MIFLSTVLACLLIGSGLSAVFIGSGMIVLERGWSMVISGSIVATGGVLLLGIVIVIRELRRLPDRLADVLPEALSTQLLYAVGETAAHQEPAEDAFAPLRPRLDHGTESQWPDDGEPSPAATTPAGTSRPPVDFLDENPLTDIYPVPDIPPPARTDAPAAVSTTQAEPPAIPRIAPADSRKQVGDGETTNLPVTPPEIGRDDRLTDSASGKQSRPFWSRLGRSDKPATEPALKTPPLMDDDAAATEQPPEPTTAELARQRLALADTPETDNQDTEKTSADPIPQPSTESRIATPLEPNQNAVADAPVAAKSSAPDKQDGKPLSGAERVRSEAAEQKHDNESRPTTPATKTADEDKDKATDDIVTTVDEKAPTVVGSYRAGANLFIMYQDGTIEAETPTGIFRFMSLDDLKAYIASGEDPALAGPRIDRPRTTAEPDATASGSALPKN